MRTSCTGYVPAAFVEYLLTIPLPRQVPTRPPPLPGIQEDPDNPDGEENTEQPPVVPPRHPRFYTTIEVSHTCPI